MLGLYTEGVSWCESLNSDCLSWPAVREYLQDQPSVLKSFTDIEDVGQERLSDIRLARKAGGFAFEYWCSEGDLKDVELLLQHFNAVAGDYHWLDHADEGFPIISRDSSFGTVRNRKNNVQYSEKWLRLA